MKVYVCLLLSDYDYDVKVFKTFDAAYEFVCKEYEKEKKNWAILERNVKF